MNKWPIHITFPSCRWDISECEPPPPSLNGSRVCWSISGLDSCYKVVLLQCQSGSVVFQADPLLESQRWVPQGTISGSLTMSSQSSSQDKYRFNSVFFLNPETLNLNSLNILFSISEKIYRVLCFYTPSNCFIEMLPTLSRLSPVSFLLRNPKTASSSVVASNSPAVWLRTFWLRKS